MLAVALVCFVGLVSVPRDNLQAANSSIAPVGITRGPDGNLWFTEFNGDHIGRITPAGKLSGFPLPTPLFTQGVTAGPDGNVWFSAGMNQIGRITPTGHIRLFALPQTGHFVLNLAAGSDGNVWFVDVIGNAIGRITPLGHIREFRFGPKPCPFPATGTCGARAGALGPDGAVWITMASGQVGQVRPIGRMRFFPLPKDANLPNGITPGSSACHCLWYSYPAGLGRISTAGVVTVYRFKPGSPSPEAIAVGADGTIWFSASGIIGRFAPSSRAIAMVFRRSGERIGGITIGPGGALWFTESQSDKIGRVTVRGILREFSLTPG
jgi:virginiamycin B lyase